MSANRIRVVVLLVMVLCFQLSVLGQDEDTVNGLSGKIAYIGTDRNVYSLDLKTDSVEQITDNASVDSPDSVQFYRWPTWSTDGRLAYFREKFTLDSERSLVQAQFSVHISKNDTIDTTPVYVGENEAFQYAYWSPAACYQQEDCRDLAILIGGQREGTNGMFIELVRDDATSPTNMSIGITLPPFYYSWSPDGNRMLWQRSGTALEIYDVTEQKVVDVLPQLPGFFQAPSWSPIDDRLLFGVLNDEKTATDLVIFDDGKTRSLATNLLGQVAFAWSPDGNHVAYFDDSRIPVVMDAKTGETIMQSPVDGVIAFFWSPDGQRIAYITAVTSPTFNVRSEVRTTLVDFVQQRDEKIGIAWSVMTVGTGATHYYGSFQPSDDMVYLIRYFDQFAQSHRIWSPDSTHLVYSHISTREEPIISILDITEVDSVPFTIANGLIGVWSFE